MQSDTKVHLAAGGLFGLILVALLLLWAYPKILVYALLLLVAGLAYGALYLILAARLDPQGQGVVLPAHQHPPTVKAVPLPQPNTEAGFPAAPIPKKKVRRKKAVAKKKATATAADLESTTKKKTASSAADAADAVDAPKKTKKKTARRRKSPPKKTT